MVSLITIYFSCRSHSRLLLRLVRALRLYAVWARRIPDYCPRWHR